MNSVTDLLSFTGFVLGMQQTAVNPPAFAAAVPAVMVSLYSYPGSRRCTCMSMRPGTTNFPAASMTWAPSDGSEPGLPSFAIFPSVTRRSNFPSTLFAVSMIWPFFINIFM